MHVVAKNYEQTDAHGTTTVTLAGHVHWRLITQCFPCSNNYFITVHICAGIFFSCDVLVLCVCVFCDSFLCSISLLLLSHFLSCILNSVL